MAVGMDEPQVCGIVRAAPIAWAPHGGCGAPRHFRKPGDSRGTALVVAGRVARGDPPSLGVSCAVVASSPEGSGHRGNRSWGLPMPYDHPCQAKKLFDGVVTSPARAKPVADPLKPCFPERFQGVFHHGLDTSIDDGGNAKQPFAFALGDIDPPDRVNLVQVELAEPPANGLRTTRRARNQQTNLRTVNWRRTGCMPQGKSVRWC